MMPGEEDPGPWDIPCPLFSTLGQQRRCSERSSVPVGQGGASVQVQVAVSVQELLAAG